MDNLDRCYNCFNKKSSGEACPYCGYTNGKSAENPIFLPEGTVLNGQYLIGAAVGHGGFGITYAALDTHLERKVAVKEYFPNGISTRTSETPTVFSLTTQATEQNYEYGKIKFIEEAKTLARFGHLDSIVYVYGYFEANNTAYIVMEYLEGEDLMQYAKKRGGRLSWEDAIRLVAPVFDALEAVHEAGLIHRDISPDNIFITNQGKTKLLDFGTARFAMGEKSKSLSVILKPGYAPPEQYFSRGKQGPWTDIYALAATLYKLITGETPPEAMERQMSGGGELELAMYAGIPESFKSGILKALSLEPAYRQQTIRQLRENLFVTDEPAPQYRNDTAAQEAELRQKTAAKKPDEQGVNSVQGEQSETGDLATPDEYENWISATHINFRNLSIGTGLFLVAGLLVYALELASISPNTVWLYVYFSLVLITDIGVKFHVHVKRIHYGWFTALMLAGCFASLSVLVDYEYGLLVPLLLFLPVATTAVIISTGFFETTSSCEVHAVLSVINTLTLLLFMLLQSYYYADLMLGLMIPFFVWMIWNRYILNYETGKKISSSQYRPLILWLLVMGLLAIILMTGLL